MKIMTICNTLPYSFMPVLCSFVFMSALKLFCYRLLLHFWLRPTGSAGICATICMSNYQINVQFI